MITPKEIKESFLHLIYPHICTGCGSDLLNKESMLCMHCIADLPETNFADHPGNPVEKIFWGRLPVECAASGYYYTKESLMQQLVHVFKYRGNMELGIQLGRLLGKYLMQSGRFSADALIPLPLFAKKERKRGFNQAAVLCQGMAEIMKIPVLGNCIYRREQTETQTKKGRLERWRNMEGKFLLMDEKAIRNKHLVLVDDVITTGATMEACGSALIKGENVRLSIATLCVAS